MCRLVAPTPEQEAEFARWRDEIDALDQQLVLAMNERAKVVQQVGEAVDSATLVLRPTASVKSSRKIKGLNQGPLASRTLHAIWRQMMSGSFCPRTWSSHRLSRSSRLVQSLLAATRQFGESVEHVDVRSIGNVFSEVATSHCDYGMVPYENSSGGSISDTLDAFLEHDVTVYAEVKVEIRHSLYAQGEPDGIRQVMSKPQVFDQCRRWLRTHLPQPSWYRSFPPAALWNGQPLSLGWPPSVPKLRATFTVSPPSSVVSKTAATTSPCLPGDRTRSRVPTGEDKPR